MTAPSPLDAAGPLVTYVIKVDGKPIDSTMQVVSIDTWSAVNKVPRARLVLSDGSAAARNFPISSQKTFLPGARVELSAGYNGKTTLLFSGVIAKQGLEISSTDASKLVLDLADPAVKMTLVRKNAVFQGIKDSDLIGRLIAANGLTKDVAATAATHEEIVQFDASDWDLMVTRAEANGLLVMVADSKVTAKRPDTAQTPALRVEYGDSILDLKAELDSAEQYKPSAIKSYSWDYSTQKLLEAGPAALSLREPGNVSSATLADVFAVECNSRQSGAPLTQDALTEWSTAALMRSQLAKICGHVRFRGSALAQVGKTIELGGLGDRFNGPIFIGGVHHGIHENRWTTTVTFGVAARGFSAAAPRIAAPDASGQLPPARGLQTGVVKQIAPDKAGEFRVLVTLPLLQDTDGVWARLGGSYASNAIGAVFYPEIGDEVVIGFMNEDPRHPVILGSVYSKARPPPIGPDDANTMKAIVTSSQLKLIFDDKNKIITLMTPGGHSITMDDTAATITIADSHSNTVSMGPDGITIDSASSVKISAKTDITIEAGTDLKLSAAVAASLGGTNVTINADAKLSAQGNQTAELTSSNLVTVRGTLVRIN